MKVSVIIPTYNRAAIIGDTIESVLRQTVPTVEAIVVDDGSTDDTAAIVEALRLRQPAWRSRLRYLHQENRGKSVALNRGLEAVSPETEWLAFDDSDDTWQPNKLEVQLAALASYPDCGACFSDAFYVNDTGRATTAFTVAGRRLPHATGRFDDALVTLARLSHGIYMQTVIVRASVMKRVGPFDPAMRVAQDVDFLFRLALETPLCYVNLPLVDIDRTPRRSHGLTSQFEATSSRRLDAHDHMFRRWLDLVSRDQRGLRRVIDQRLQDTRSAAINRHLANNDTVAARTAAGRAFAEHRSLRFGVKWLLVACAPRYYSRRLAKVGAD